MFIIDRYIIIALSINEVNMPKVLNSCLVLQPFKVSCFFFQIIKVMKNVKHYSVKRLCATNLSC